MVVTAFSKIITSVHQTCCGRDRTNRTGDALTEATVVWTNSPMIKFQTSSIRCLSSHKQSICTTKITSVDARWVPHPAVQDTVDGKLLSDSFQWTKKRRRKDKYFQRKKKPEKVFSLNNGINEARVLMKSCQSRRLSSTTFFDDVPSITHYSCPADREAHRKEKW